MNSFFLLLVSALVSIHQYLPNDNTEYKKYYTDVRQLQEEDIFPAANQSCQFMYSVLVDAGLEATLGSRKNNPLSQVLSGIIGSEAGFQTILKMVDSPTVVENLARKNIEAVELKDFLTKLCSKEFNPLSFPPSMRKQVYNFIEQDIRVLNNGDLSGFGQFNLYGNTQIFDANNVLIGQIGTTHKNWTPVKSISPYVLLTLMAAEDQNFLFHRGVDTKSIARMIKEVTSSSRATGGSTLTMQLLKNLYFINGPTSQIEDLNSGTSQTILRKVREWYWAWPLENHVAQHPGDIQGKFKILEKYLNLVYLGPGIQGIAQASKVYFNKSPKDLDLAESAFITSLLKAPSTYSNPKNYVSKTMPRRNDYVLNKTLSFCEKVKSSLDDSYSEVLKLCRNSQTGKPLDKAFVRLAFDQDLPEWSGPTSFDIDASLGTTRTYVQQWLTSFNKENNKPFKELKVQTTVNQKLQDKVFKAVKGKIDEYDRRWQQLKHIRPARDDRGRTARIQTTDIGYSFLYNIKRLVNKQSSDTTTYLFNVSLGSQGENGGISLTDIELKLALEKLSFTPKESTRALKNIKNTIKNKKQRIGTVTFIALEATGFKLHTPTELIDIIDLPEEKLEEFETYYSRKSVEERLFKNALSRLNRYKHRDFLQPVVVSDLGQLLNKDLDPIKLTPNHNWYFTTQLSIAGYFLWVRPASGQNLDKPLKDLTYEMDAPRIQAAAIVLDANTGAVLANFGGYHQKSSSFDRSFNSERQLGSTVKPWVYFTALNKGLQPSDILANDYTSFQINNGRSSYRPKNFSGRSPGRVSLSSALIHSYNIATFNLIKDYRWGNDGDWQLNLQDVRQRFEDVGLYEKSRNNVSIMIGAQESTLARLAASYTYFANGFNIVDPRYIEKVEDHKGKLIYESEISRRYLFNESTTALFNIQLLLAEIANKGTAARLKPFVTNLRGGELRSRCFNGLPSTGKQSCFGGKTGTTNNGRDAWFVGFTKNFVVAVWVGYDENIPIPDGPTGGKLALPIFQEIITQAYDELPYIEPYIDAQSIPFGMDYQPGQIYTPSNDDFSGPSEELLLSDSEQVPQQPTASCWCSPVVNGNRTEYGINASYKGKVYNNYKPYKNLKKCKKALKNVKVSGRSICI